MILASSDSLVDHLEKPWQSEVWPHEGYDSNKYLGVVFCFFAKKNWVASFITQLETDKEGQDPGAACKV